VKKQLEAGTFRIIVFVYRFFVYLALYLALIVRLKMYLILINISAWSQMWKYLRSSTSFYGCCETGSADCRALSLSALHLL
jgi:hypothetical protein